MVANGNNELAAPYKHSKDKEKINIQKVRNSERELIDSSVVISLRSDQVL